MPLSDLARTTQLLNAIVQPKPDRTYYTQPYRRYRCLEVFESFLHICFPAELANHDRTRAINEACATVLCNTFYI